jgi:hypothetical protein
MANLEKFAAVSLRQRVGIPQGRRAIGAFVVVQALLGDRGTRGVAANREVVIARIHNEHDPGGEAAADAAGSRWAQIESGLRHFG